MIRTSTHLIRTMAALAFMAFSCVPSAFAQEQPKQPKEEPAEAQKAPLKALAKLEPRRASPSLHPTLRAAEPQTEPEADHRPKPQVRNALAPKTIYNVGL